MKRRRARLALFLAILVVGGTLAGKSIIGRRPFRHLDAAGISAVRVGLYPPDTEFDLTREEIEALIPLLREVVTYRRDDTFRKYAGQAVIFTLTGTDGTQTTVQAYNPFLVIDGAGYRTKYAPCEALNRFGHNLPER